MSKTILVIEDGVNLVELLKFRLEANGYKVEAAYDGEAGLKKILEIKPDLVVLDVMMPKMHGYEVCRLAKSNDKVKKIPIVMLTARVQSADIEKAKEAGADAYITKPFEPVDLLAEIERLIGK